MDTSRREERTPIDRLIWYSRIDDNDAVPYMAMMADYSHSGIGLFTDEALAPGDRLRSEDLGDFIDRPSTVVVRWSKKIALNYRVGLEFLYPPEKVAYM